MSDMPEPIHARANTPNATMTEKEQRESYESFENWIEHFYGECGREVTLAYTTLNQMKNWAMVIVGALLSAVVALTKTDSLSGQSSQTTVNIATLLVAVIAYVFTLRFFVRAILCYINLIRWNTLQSDIVAYEMMVPVDGVDNPGKDERRQKLVEDIAEYYHRWTSPIDRKTQLISNLKLGFALVLTLPLFFIVIGIIHLWPNHLAIGLATFALGSSIVEVTEFKRSSFFDDRNARQRRARGKHQRHARIFPIPTSRTEYLVLWMLTLLVSGIVTLWPQVKALLNGLLSCGR